MTTKQRLLSAGVWACSAIVLSATLVHAAGANAAGSRSLTIKDVSGAVRLQQGLPCGDRLDLTTSIAQGSMQLTWLQVTRTEVIVDLTQVNMLLAPFRAEANCQGVSGAVDFQEIGVQLASAVRFRAAQAPESGLLHFRIPKERFLLYESVVSNAPVQHPNTSYQRPSEDITGVIDLRRQTVQLHVVMATELRFRVGCQGDRCAIDETHVGTATTDIRGASTPAATPPVVIRRTTAAVEPRREG
jgi:hypothetical protein